MRYSKLILSALIDHDLKCAKLNLMNTKVELICAVVICNLKRGHMKGQNNPTHQAELKYSVSITRRKKSGL